MALPVFRSLHLNEYGHAAKHLQSHGNQHKRHPEVLDLQDEHRWIVAVVCVGNLALDEEGRNLLDVQLLLQLQGLVDE